MKLQYSSKNRELLTYKGKVNILGCAGAVLRVNFSSYNEQCVLFCIALFLTHGSDGEL